MALRPSVTPALACTLVLSLAACGDGDPSPLVPPPPEPTVPTADVSAFGAAVDDLTSRVLPALDHPRAADLGAALVDVRGAVDGDGTASLTRSLDRLDRLISEMGTGDGEGAAALAVELDAFRLLVGRGRPGGAAR